MHIGNKQQSIWGIKRKYTSLVLIIFDPINW